MKRVVRLTESDLARIVKRVIKEDTLKDSFTPRTNKAKSYVYDLLTKKRYEKAINLVGGVSNFVKILELNSPDDFLKLFDNLKSEVYEPNPQWSFLKDHNGTKIIGILTYPSGRKRVTFNNRILGGVLSYVLDVPPHKVEGVLAKWLKDAYGIEADEYSSSGGFGED